jgi:beta-lactam-binding protein with PASTA domain
VSAQDPPASTTVATTTAIVLTISSGPNAIEVPDVSGKTQTAARQAIESAGLTVGDVTTEENTSENPNRVTRTVPAAGDQVAPNTQVKIYLSSPTVTMPNLIDKTEKAAKAQLKKVDLNVDTASEPSEDAAPGTVIRTSPDAGTKVERGSTVTHVLAEKPDTTPTETPSTTPSPSPSVSVSIGTG